MVMIDYASRMDSAPRLETDASFDVVVMREKRRLFAIALSILRDSGEAEDAVQETLVKAWKAWDTLRDREKPSAWLTRVCVNHCISKRRGLLSRGWMWRKELSENTEAPGGLMKAELVDFDRVYKRLSVQQRTALTLNYRHGYSVDECADLMGCRPGTVRSHLGRALANLRKEMTDD